MWPLFPRGENGASGGWAPRRAGVGLFCGVSGAAPDAAREQLRNHPRVHVARLQPLSRGARRLGQRGRGLQVPACLGQRRVGAGARPGGQPGSGVRSVSREWRGGSSQAVSCGPGRPGGGICGHWRRDGRGGAPASRCGQSRARGGRQAAGLGRHGSGCCVPSWPWQRRP